MEVADPTDHRGRRHDLVAIGGEVSQEGRVLRVALDEAVVRVIVERLGNAAVLGEVVEADDVMARLEKLRNEVPVDETGGTGDQDPHYRRIPWPIAPQTSTTSLPPICSSR